DYHCSLYMGGGISVF
nr:immunoglobulin light chain junction region [Macaca mulatta]MOY07298.1 immunoglobulin light chain junction region [Macaca mulatta]